MITELMLNSVILSIEGVFVGLIVFGIVICIVLIASRGGGRGGGGGFSGGGCCSGGSSCGGGCGGGRPSLFRACPPPLLALLPYPTSSLALRLARFARHSPFARRSPVAVCRQGRRRQRVLLRRLLLGCGS